MKFLKVSLMQHIICDVFCSSPIGVPLYHIIEWISLQLVKCSEQIYEGIYVAAKFFNQVLANAPILYPLITKGFLEFSGGI